MYVSECESVCGCYLYIWCMRDELRECHLIDEGLGVYKVVTGFVCEGS